MISLAKATDINMPPMKIEPFRPDTINGFGMSILIPKAMIEMPKITELTISDSSYFAISSILPPDCSLITDHR